ncbi:MAG: phage major capsid protein [Burkholderiaceae bacterium]|nr:phage major capsid protein [Burkholderiaceae bacterium]
MSAVLSHRYWSRADAPARRALLDALAAMQPGQRLRVADALRRRDADPADDAEQRAQADAPPPLVDYTSGAIRGARVDPDTREVELSFSSEAPYERWWGVEILGHKAGEIDLSWMASGRAPLLSNHDTDAQIGVVTRAWLDAKSGRARAVVRFGRSERAEQELRDALDDVRVNVSVGYEIRELELISKEKRGDTEVATYRVTDWLPLECSLVSIPADMTVGIGRSVDAETVAPARAPAAPREPRMEQPMTQTVEKPVQGDEAFKANVATIQRLAKAYGQWLKPNDVADVIAEGADPQRMNDLIMQRMQSGATDVTSLPALGASTREQKQYSFLRAIQAQIPGANVDAGLEREVSREIARTLGREAEGFFIPPDVMFRSRVNRDAMQQRDFNVGTASEAGNLVQTTVMADMFTDVLRAATVLVDLGVTVLPGLRANVGVPRKTVAGTLAMLTEVAGATETQPTTALPTLSPKRVAAYVEPSKQAIIQAEIGIEAMLRQDLVDGAAVLIEAQGINGTGSSPQARGIRNVSGIGSVVGGTNGANLAWSHITGLEAACANANAVATQRAGYLVNTKTVNTAKNTQKAANLQFIWDGGERPLNGYRVGITNNVPSNLTKGTSNGVCSSVIFSSDWSMFVLGLFGGLDVTVDPYTLAASGQVRITLNQFFDWLCRQPGAFAVMDDALTP